MSQMLKSSGAMGFATAASRVLGLVREQVYARFMGDGPVASAFVLAFQIPNLFRRLLGEGALTAAFIPIFKAKERHAGEVEMWRAANAVISGLVVVTCLVVGLLMLAISLILALASAHYTQAGSAVFPPYPVPILRDDTRLMLALLRVMAPYLVLVCLAALAMGMLNARGHFFIPAMGSTSLNLVMIASVLFLAPHFGRRLDQQIFALAVGVVVAGLAQFGFQLPTLWADGFRYRWVSPWRDATVREVVRKMIPAAVGVAAFQLNVLLIQTIAFWIDRYIVASFNYAVRLMEFPQGVVGISLATYLLAALSGLASEKNYPGFRATLREGLGHLIFVNLIASALLVVLAEPIVRLLFEHGAFSASSTRRVALALTCLAPGLVAFSTVNVLARSFYALGDTTTPMKISVVCLGLNLVFSLWFIGPLHLAGAGMGLANTLSSGVNVWLLLYALRRKLSRLELETLRPLLVALLGAAIVAGGVAWLVRWGWDAQVGHQRLFERLGEVFVPMAAGGLVYVLLALWLKVPQAREMGGLLLKRLRGRKGGQGEGPG